MLAWIKRHPLLLLSIALATLFITVFVILLYPGWRERQVLAELQSDYPDLYLYPHWHRHSPAWIRPAMEQVGLEKYCQRVYRLEINGYSLAAQAPYTAIDLHCLKHFPQVERLHLQRMALSPQSIAGINTLKRLTRLRLESVGILETGRLSLHDLPRLKEIYCNGLLIEDISLSSLPQLTTLDLKNSRIKDETLRHIASQETLTGLGLANSRLTDEGLQHLKLLPRLKWIDLRHNRPTPSGYPPYSIEGLIDLQDHPRLETLGLNDTFDKAQLERLREAVPRFANRWNYPVSPEQRKERIRP